MKDKPNCKICTFKCLGCNSYFTCLMRQGLDGWSIEDCIRMASKYYMYDEYLRSPNTDLCKFQDECKSVVECWL